MPTTSADSISSSLAAFMTQCNDMDLSRRSPSYESRLSKYSHRGFEVYCDFLDRSKIDPTIFERNFASRFSYNYSDVLIELS